MQISPSFLKFASMFYRHSFDNHETIQSWVVSSLQILNNIEREELLKYLQSYIDEGYDGGDFRNLWRQTEADYQFNNAEMLKMILETIKNLSTAFVKTPA